MKLRNQLSATAGRLTEYAGGKQIARHRAVTQAVGKTCAALLEIVDQEQHPTTHQVITAVGRVAAVATITADAVSGITEAFHEPEVSEGTQAELTGPGTTTGVPSPSQLMEAALGIE